LERHRVPDERQPAQQAGAVIRDRIRYRGINLGFGTKWTRCLLARPLSE